MLVLRREVVSTHLGVSSVSAVGAQRRALSGAGALAASGRRGSVWHVATAQAMRMRERAACPDPPVWLGWWRPAASLSTELSTEVT